MIIIIIFHRPSLFKDTLVAARTAAHPTVGKPLFIRSWSFSDQAPGAKGERRLRSASHVAQTVILPASRPHRHEKLSDITTYSDIIRSGGCHTSATFVIYKREGRCVTPMVNSGPPVCMMLKASTAKCGVFSQVAACNLMMLFCDRESDHACSGSLS